MYFKLVFINILNRCSFQVRIENLTEKTFKSIVLERFQIHINNKHQRPVISTIYITRIFIY